MKQYVVALSMLWWCCRCSCLITHAFQVSCCRIHHHPNADQIVSFLTALSSQKETQQDGPNNNKIRKKGSRFTQSVHIEATAVKKESRRQTEPKSSSSSSSSSSSAPFNKDRMWRSTKTIEELEAKLTSRWGTDDLTRWTSDTDVDGESDNDTPLASSTLSAFRAKPVRDPWSSEDDNDEKDCSSGRKQDESHSKRVRQMSSSTPSKRPSALSAFGSPKIDLKHLIADKPAGGQGTNAVAPSPIAANDKLPVPIQVKQKAKASKELDGTALLLTLPQAERFFMETLNNTLTGIANAAVEEEEQQEEWQDLGISHPQLLENLRGMRCSTPLQVQRNSCRAILNKDQDVVIGTYTGSGKTLAFLTPIVQRLLEYNSTEPTHVLIVAPGRELASQIVSVARELTCNTKLAVMLAIGGTTFQRNLDQIRKRKPEIVVGTPGRIAELVVGRAGEKRGRLSVKNLEILVLDEFDALLEYKPHSDPTHAVLETLKRLQGHSFQSILCSATATDLLSNKTKNAALIAKCLRPNPVITMADKDDILVTAADGNQRNTRVSRTVIHGVVHVEHRRFALDTLRRILHTDPMPQQILIFAADARKVEVLVDKLDAMGILAAPLHGGMGSEKMDRAEVSKALREGYVGIVVATELAARGLDAPLLTHVINMDLPTDASHYAHRAGRCGRGGRPGVVINLTTSPQERSVPQKFADQLGITMHTVEVKNSQLNIVDVMDQEVD